MRSVSPLEFAISQNTGETPSDQLASSCCDSPSYYATFPATCECVTSHRIPSPAARSCRRPWPRLRQRQRAVCPPARRTFLPVLLRAEGRGRDGAGGRGRATTRRARRQRSFPSPVAFLPRALNSLSRFLSVAGRIASWMDVVVFAKPLPPHPRRQT